MLLQALQDLHCGVCLIAVAACEHTYGRAVRQLLCALAVSAHNQTQCALMMMMLLMAVVQGVCDRDWCGGAGGTLQHALPTPGALYPRGKVG